MSVDDAGRLRHLWRVTTTKLDLTGLKCPLPALMTRKALKAPQPGDLLEVHCTDPRSVTDIPNLIREIGDKVEITERVEQRLVFPIEKADRLLPQRPRYAIRTDSRVFCTAARLEAADIATFCLST
jgi:tRNA 2-thiouridine synthesizing protein A